MLQEKQKGPLLIWLGELIVLSFLEMINEKKSLEISFSQSERELTKHFTHIPVLHISCTVFKTCWKTREQLQDHEALDPSPAQPNKPHFKVKWGLPLGLKHDIYFHLYCSTKHTHQPGLVVIGMKEETIHAMAILKLQDKRRSTASSEVTNTVCQTSLRISEKAL